MAPRSSRDPKTGADIGGGGQSPGSATIPTTASREPRRVSSSRTIRLARGPVPSTRFRRANRPSAAMRQTSARNGRMIAIRAGRSRARVIAMSPPPVRTLSRASGHLAPCARIVRHSRSARSSCTRARSPEPLGESSITAGRNPDGGSG